MGDRARIRVLSGMPCGDVVALNHPNHRKQAPAQSSFNAGHTIKSTLIVVSDVDYVNV